MSNEYRAMKSWALSLLVLGSCTKPNPASCLDDFCSDPALPFCDVDGSIGGIPDTCIAVECMPGELQGCRGDNALICSETGTDIDETACEFGCGETGCLPCNTPDCQPAEKHIIPKFVPTACDDLATTSLDVAEDTTFDTSNDETCSAIVTQTTGPDICVVHHESITIASNRTLRVTGERAIALVADREFAVGGIIDASADGDKNGPGGGSRSSGMGGTVVNNIDVVAGGGGAGNRTRGGNGANETTNGGVANGGDAELNQTTLDELLAGPQAAKSATGAVSAGSGGAMTLICCRCELSITGTLDANGEGGKGQTQSFGTPALQFAPSGGGAGGNIVLQGMQISVEGQVFSNGGGGGAGGGNILGDNGEKGRRSAQCANGAPAPGGGLGGKGGCAGSPPGVGVAATSPGAGGGSTGFLITFTPSGTEPELTPFAVSPAFEPNRTVPTN